MSNTRCCVPGCDNDGAHTKGSVPPVHYYHWLTKDVITVMPPRGSSKGQATQEEMELTRQIASVRIHVERAIQRLKIFKILTHRFGSSLLPVVNEIVLVCAALVNLQTAIIKRKLTTLIEEVHDQQDEDELAFDEEIEEDEGVETQDSGSETEVDSDSDFEIDSDSETDCEEN